LSQVRRWQSGVGRGPRLRSVRMTRTFQNGREQPTTCISGFFWRPQCKQFLHPGREQSQQFIVRFVFLNFSSRRSQNIGSKIADSVAYSRISHVSCLWRCQSSYASCPLVGRGGSWTKCLLLLLIYKHVSFFVTFQFFGRLW